MDLAPAEALALRMASLLLRARPGGSSARQPADVAGVVTWFGAMQAQDLASAMWSLGARLPASTAADVHAALERRTAADAKRGIAAAGEDLTTVRVGDRDMILEPGLLDAHRAEGAAGAEDDMLALPGFDEYLLGYKDRSLMLAAEHKQAIIPGGNGVFQPTVVRGGRVIGTWKRSVSRGRTVVDLRPLVALDASDRARVEDALEPYGRFTGRPLVTRWA